MVEPTLDSFLQCVPGNGHSTLELLVPRSFKSGRSGDFKVGGLREDAHDLLGGKLRVDLAQHRL